MMKLFKRPPKADVSMLRVELAKAQMTIHELDFALMRLRKHNIDLNERITQFIDAVELDSNEDDLWDLLEILRGQR